MGLFHKTDEELLEILKDDIAENQEDAKAINKKTQESRVYKVTILKDKRKIDEYIGEVRILESFYRFYTSWDAAGSNYEADKLELAKFQVIKNGDVYSYPSDYTIKLEKGADTKTNKNNVIEIFANDADEIKNRLHDYEEYQYVVIWDERIETMDYYNWHCYQARAIE